MKLLHFLSFLSVIHCLSPLHVFVLLPDNHRCLKVSPLPTTTTTTTLTSIPLYCSPFEINTGPFHHCLLISTPFSTVVSFLVLSLVLPLYYNTIVNCNLLITTPLHCTFRSYTHPNQTLPHPSTTTTTVFIFVFLLLVYVITQLPFTPVTSLVPGLLRRGNIMALNRTRAGLRRGTIILVPLSLPLIATHSHCLAPPTHCLYPTSPTPTLSHLMHTPHVLLPTSTTSHLQLLLPHSSSLTPPPLTASTQTSLSHPPLVFPSS